MLKGFLLTIALLPALATNSLGADLDSRKETYRIVSNALRAGDFETLRQYLSLQPGLTIETLEENWDRVQKTFQNIFPSPDEFAVIQSFKAANGDYYWIVEMIEVEANNKHLKFYKFVADSENTLSWKVSGAKQTGSFPYPDHAGIRVKIIEDIRRSIETESQPH